MARPRIADSVLDHVGGTPLVRAQRIAEQEGLRCNLRASTRVVRPADDASCASSST